MVFVVSFLLGVSATALRSAAAVAIVAIFIALTFVAAYVVSAGDVSFWELALAIIGYNTGIVGLLVRGAFVKA